MTCRPRIEARPEKCRTIDIVDNEALTIVSGSRLYALCGACHGEFARALGKVDRGGAVPDLRYSPYLQTQSSWQEAVLEGSLVAKGMPVVLKDAGMGADEAEAIRAYVIHQAWKAYENNSFQRTSADSK